MVRFGFKNLRHEGSRGLFFSPLPETRRGKLLPLALSLFFIFCLLNTNVAFAGSATLSWTPPTTNVDSTPLTDLAGYKVYYGTSSGNYTQSININNTATTTYQIDNLTDGTTYYFSVTAYDTLNNESGYSNEACRTIGTSTCNSSTGGDNGGGNNSPSTDIQGGGCGFVKNDNGTGQKAKGELLSIAMLFLLLILFRLRKESQKIKVNC